MENNGMLDFLKITAYPNLKSTEDANKKRVSELNETESGRGNQADGQDGNAGNEISIRADKAKDA